MWKTPITTAEEEILDVHGVTGGEAEKIRGRAREPRWVLRTMRWRPSPNLPKPTESATCPRWIARKLLDIHLLVKNIHQKGLSDKKSAMRDALRVQCKQFLPKLQTLEVPEAAKWVGVLEQAGKATAWTVDSDEPLAT